MKAKTVTASLSLILIGAMSALGADTASIDGNVKAELSVTRSAWTWWTLGIYRPVKSKVHAYELVKKERRRWYCLWLCTETVTVREGRPANIENDVVSN